MSLILPLKSQEIFQKRSLQWAESPHFQAFWESLNELNHNSVLGIREYARRTGSRLEYIPLQLPELGLDEAKLETLLEWIEMAQQQG